MGLPFVKKQELYDFFQDYMNEIESGIRASTNYSKSAEKPLINKIQGLWSTTPNDQPETARSRVSKSDIDRHLTTCFTNGVTSNHHLSGLRPPGIESDLPHMSDDPVAYNFFLFWLDQPQNEWLDAFLFELAGKWQEVKKAQEKDQSSVEFRSSLSMALQETVSFRSSRLNSIIGKELFDGKERQYVAKLLAEIDDKQLEVAAILAEIRELIEVKRDLLEAEHDPYLISLNGIQLSPHFEANGFLVRRVKENKKNIGKVRYALKELDLGKD